MRGKRCRTCDQGGDIGDDGRCRWCRPDDPNTFEPSQDERIAALEAAIERQGGAIEALCRRVGELRAEVRALRMQTQGDGR